MIKYLNTSEGVMGYIEFLKKKKESFTWKFTNYTHTIEVNGQKRFFYDGGNDSFKLFAAQKKLEKDIRASEERGIYFDEIEHSEITYNLFNGELLLPCITFGEVWNIDLKSAYLQALYNVGLITKETYEYIQSAPKPIRLKAVGMLATRKNCFTYEKGEFKSYTSTTKDLKKYFFLASKIVGDLLSKLKNMCDDNLFIFFWVDGIYILNRGDHQATRELMKMEIIRAGFNYSEELLTNFHTTEKSIIYNKKNTEKIFPLPKKDDKIAELKQYQKNEIKSIIIK